MKIQLNKTPRVLTKDAPIRRDERMRALLEEVASRTLAAEKRASHLRSLSTVLGWVSAILAGAAAVTVLPDNIARWVTGVIAFLAAVVSTVNVIWNPQKRSREAAAHEVALRRIYSDICFAIEGEDWDQLGALTDRLLTEIRAEAAGTERDTDASDKVALAHP